MCQHFLHLQRQGKRPKVHVKQKGFKNFFSTNNTRRFKKKTFQWDNCGATFNIPKRHIKSIIIPMSAFLPLNLCSGSEN